MNFVSKLLIWCFCACLLAFRAEARWKPEYATLPPEVRAWYREAQTMPNSTPRLKHGWVSCCEHGDVVDAKFEARKVDGRYRDEWYYKTDGMTGFKRIPDDIIHFGEAAPWGLPTLFIYNGIEVCFWPPNGAS
jgi:hypothetical protein